MSKAQEIGQKVQGQTLDAVRNTQDAVVEAVTAWTETARPKATTPKATKTSAPKAAKKTAPDAAKKSAARKTATAAKKSSAVQPRARWSKNQ